MKNIYIGILIMLCLLPITLATLEVDEIKIKVNEDSISADEEGGDIDVKRGDDLIIKVYFDNDWDNKSYVRLKGEIEYIDEGDDIIEWKPGDNFNDWYEIDSNDKTFKTLTFEIPEDADYDSYDLDFTIYYNQTNGVNDSWDYSWDVILEKEYEEDEKNLQEQLEEIRGAINSSNEGTYYNLYNKCFINLTGCQSYKNSNEGYKTNYDLCINTRDAYSQQSYQCSLDYKYLNTSYYNFINITYGACIIERDNYASQRFIWGFIIGLGGFGLGWYLFKYRPIKSKVGDVGSKESSPSMNVHPTIDQMVKGKVINIPIVSPPTPLEPNPSPPPSPSIQPLQLEKRR